MPTLKLILASVAISLALATPALAQNGASSDQYDFCSGRPTVACVQSLQDGVKAAAENAAKSAEASGEALTDDDSAGTGDNNAPTEKGSSVAREAGIERLPDTGGASTLISGVGLLLIAAGLLRSRIVR